MQIVSVALFNESLNNGCFPDELKLADITPIFKKGDATNEKNYRQVYYMLCRKFLKGYCKPKLTLILKHIYLLTYVGTEKGTMHLSI